MKDASEKTRASSEATEFRRMINKMNTIQDVCNVCYILYRDISHMDVSVMQNDDIPKLGVEIER